MRSCFYKNNEYFCTVALKICTGPQSREIYRLLPRMRPLRPLLGLPALRVRPFGSARRLYRGVDRGHPDHSGRGSTQSPRHPGGSDRSGTGDAGPGTRGDRPATASDRTEASRQPRLFRRNLFRLPGRHLHPAQGYSVPPPGPGAAFARSVRFRHRRHQLGIASQRIEMEP